MDIFNTNSGERLFLEDSSLFSDGQRVDFNKTNLPNVDMEDLIVRHKARYGLVSLFCRTGLKVLDFPCGSGYASKILSEYRVDYFGADIDKRTIDYAIYNYLGYGYFFIMNLKDIDINKKFDIIACIEGIEHIERKHQSKVIKKLYKLLNPEGVLIISSPEKNENKNKYHLGEMKKQEFINLLHGRNWKVEIITQRNKLSTGEISNCFYGVCKK